MQHERFGEVAHHYIDPLRITLTTLGCNDHTLISTTVDMPNREYP